MTALHARLIDRLGLWSIPLLLVFWTALWPLAIVWGVGSALLHQARLDRSAEARRERRVARLLRWYPRRWRARHGDEFAALVHDTIDDGRGGPRLTLDVARTALAERVEASDRSSALLMTCWASCGILIFPQGIVPMIMMLTGFDSRSWFLALHVPQPFGWLVAGAMLAIGVAMLAWAITTTRRLAAVRRAACVATD